jgi:DNA-binding response OmpR family regulator
LGIPRLRANKESNMRTTFDQSLLGRNILVVDDNESIVKLVSDVLSDGGANVLSSLDAETALAELSNGSFDLLMLDLVMPGCDGWECMQRLSQSRPNMLGRTLLMTGDRWRTDTIRRIHNSRIPVIFKPFHISELRAAASEVIRVAELSSGGRNLGRAA